MNLKKRKKVEKLLQEYEFKYRTGKISAVQFINDFSLDVKNLYGSNITSSKWISKAIKVINDTKIKGNAKAKEIAPKEITEKNC